MRSNTDSKRSTIYFDPELHYALRLKAAETDRSVSDLVNEAVKLSFAEDAEDLAAIEEIIRAGNAVRRLRQRFESSWQDIGF